MTESYTIKGRHQCFGMSQCSVLGFSKGKIHFFPKVLKNWSSSQKNDYHFLGGGRAESDKYHFIVSISQSLNQPLCLRYRDRADTIITLYHTTPPSTENIIGIVSSSPNHFHSENIGLIRVTYDPPVSIRVNRYYSDLYSSVIHHWNRQLKPY